MDSLIPKLFRTYPWYNFIVNKDYNLWYIISMYQQNTVNQMLTNYTNIKFITEDNIVYQNAIDWIFITKTL